MFKSISYVLINNMTRFLIEKIYYSGLFLTSPNIGLHPTKLEHARLFQRETYALLARYNMPHHHIGQRCRIKQFACLLHAHQGAHYHGDQEKFYQPIPMLCDHSHFTYIYLLRRP